MLHFKVRQLNSVGKSGSISIALKYANKSKKMRMNKIGASNAWIWIVLIAVGVVLYTNGSLNGILGGGASTPTPDKTILYPSTLETTITLNTKDALATTDTNANVSYYVFKSDGSFLKSGTTATGTASFTVNYIGDYEILAYSDSTYYPVTSTFTVEEGAAQKTINLALNAVSNLTVVTVRDPVDFDQNMSCSAGATSDFEVIYKTTKANAATYKPVIVVDANSTSSKTVTMSGLTAVGCPSRLTTSAGRQKYCFQADTVASTAGQTAKKGTITWSASPAVGASEQTTISVLDTQEYADTNFATIGKAAFHEGTQNPADLSNVGASDSQMASGKSAFVDCNG